MIRTLPILSAIPALALAACGPPAPTDAGLTNTTGAVAGTDYVERLRTMPAGQRNATLMRAVRDAGQTCQGVTSSAEVGAAAGTATWSATCDGGGRWIVAIGRDGNASVTDQANVRAPAAR